MYVTLHNHSYRIENTSFYSISYVFFNYLLIFLC
ncbi:hypothetical protein SAMN05421780_102192 [Flexibacter flexilis DSM 6793]|uniref:Uncharacterized protein n=1 Tax=Flexibacter flexilis DSM 6793 TaxID=927664 RepID=A0A1I1FP54_9BACT|nr:hypothetical protein SAMN05421780_102192 [Flexibacter flexilis DSM 6793]